eukprot:2432816-Rhodomonas_salina.2
MAGASGERGREQVPGHRAGKPVRICTRSTAPGSDLALVSTSRRTQRLEPSANLGRNPTSALHPTPKKMYMLATGSSSTIHLAPASL